MFLSVASMPEVAFFTVVDILAFGVFSFDISDEVFDGVESFLAKDVRGCS